MAQRGGNSLNSNKRQFKPNLATANKREPKANTDSSMQGDSSGKPSNAQRGRGRGGRGRSMIEKTSSIFEDIGSAGIVTPQGRYNYGKGDHSTADYSHARPRVGLSEVKTDNVGYSVVGEQPIDGATSSLEIIDDSNADEIALLELLQDEKPFISDLRTAEVRPIDINKIMSTRSEKPVGSQGYSVDAVEPRHSVAKALRDCQTDVISTSSKYIFMQLPPAIDDMLLRKVKDEQNDDVIDEKIDPVGAVESVNNEPSSEDALHRKHCLSRVPQGRIGKVQVMASGKAFLMIGDVRYELRTALPVDCRQEIVNITLPSSGAKQQQQGGTYGSMHVLGTIGARLTVEANVVDLVASYRRKQSDRVYDI